MVEVGKRTGNHMPVIDHRFGNAHAHAAPQRRIGRQLSVPATACAMSAAGTSAGAGLAGVGPQYSGKRRRAASTVRQRTADGSSQHRASGSRSAPRASSGRIPT